MSKTVRRIVSIADGNENKVVRSRKIQIAADITVHISPVFDDIR